MRKITGLTLWAWRLLRAPRNDLEEWDLEAGVPRGVKERQEAVVSWQDIWKAAMSYTHLKTS